MTDISVQVRARPGEEGLLSSASTTEKLINRIDELTDAIGEVAKRMHQRLDAELVAADATEQRGEPAAGWALHEVSIVFSADLEAEAGVIIARTKATAGFEVSLAWSRTAG